MTDPLSISHEIVRDIFLAAYTRRVGVGADKISVPDLQDATQIDARTLRSWRESDQLPQLVKFMRLAAVVGPQLVNLAHSLEEQGKAMIRESKAAPHK